MRTIMRAAALAGMLSVAASPGMVIRRREQPEYDVEPLRSEAPWKHPRGKGKQAKPRKRSNRLTISKRVRRKHRRQS